MNYNQKIDLAQKANLFVGVDIAKMNHGVSLKDRTGKEICKPYMIANTRSGFESLLPILQPYNKNEVLIGMEPTGHYWKCMAYFLQDQGYKPVLVNPFHVSRTKEVMENTKSKTDLKDSKLIGLMVKEGKFLEPLLLTGAYADLRELTKTRHIIIKETTSAKIRLIALIDEFIPEYNTCIKTIACKTSLLLLKTFSLLTLKSNFLEQEKINLIVKTSRGQINIKKAKEIVDRLSDSIGVNEGSNGVQLRVKILLEQLEIYQKQRDEIDACIKVKLSETDEHLILLTMRGVGIITAAEFLGQTGPLKNFSNAKKLEKLAGLDLSEKSSGKIFGRKSFSKRGRDLLRHALYKITIAAIAHDNELKQLYQYKINVLKKTKMVAIGSTMVKVLRTIFGIIKSKSQYDGKKVCAGLPQIQAQA
jgi:transposase